jgi:hypothetical protein
MANFTPYIPEGDGYLPIQVWGKDHWSTLAYLETCTVDRRGIVDNNRMRCNPRLHREFMSTMPGANTGEPNKYPTRLAVGVQNDHDDWSCLEDMVAAGLVKASFRQVRDVVFGSNQACVELTPDGRKIANQLRQFRAQHGNYNGFKPCPLKGTKMSRTISLEDYFNECIDRFGHDRNNWKFVCPSCGHIASVADYKNAGAEKAIGYSCVARWTGATQEAFRKGPGPCNYAGGGLISINPVKVVSADGAVFMFELGPAEPWVKPGDEVAWTETGGREGRTITMKSRAGTVQQVSDFIATVQSGRGKPTAVAEASRD